MTNTNNKAREISADERASTDDQISGKLLDVHTSMPAIVISYNADERTVTAQPAIQRVFSEGEGLEGATNLPPCVDVPVIFPMGGGYELTFPIKAGDECLLIFSERCIDNWFGTGEPSEPADFRQHDLSDAIAYVGIRSLKNKQPTWTGGVELHGNGNHVRIDANSVQLSAGGATLKLTASGLNCSVPITAPNVITDNMDVNGHVHDESIGSTTGKGY